MAILLLEGGGSARAPVSSLIVFFGATHPPQSSGAPADPPGGDRRERGLSGQRHRNRRSGRCVRTAHATSTAPLLLRCFAEFGAETRGGGVARIFISYRREDSDFLVSRLVDELRKHFPTEQVFQDIGSIDPGADFVEALEKGLSTAAVMLAVIGQHWLSTTDKQGRRRMDMPGDFVRQEIAESLRRPGVRVFPLLVNGAEMPDEEELPEPLKALHRRQAFALTERHWHQDVAQLVQTLKRAPGVSGDRKADEDFTPPEAEQAAQRREAEERAAKEEAERIAAED